jgi:hypothetical protein
MSKDIEVKIDGPNLTPERFMKAARAFFDLVQGVARNMTGTQDAIPWTVEVKSGSAILRARSTNERAERAVQAVIRGVNSLRSGIQAAPPWYGRDEINAARLLASLVDGADITSIQIKNGNTPEEMSPTVVATVDAILESDKSIAFGSIEGVIEMLSIRDGFRCTVYEPNYGRGINCYFNKVELEREAHLAFGKRVLLSGMIRYGKEGLPTTLHADALRVFPPDAELPTAQEIQAIYKEIYK